jgi:hypothetical protein
LNHPLLRITGSDVEGGTHQLALVDLVSLENADDTAVIHDEHTVAAADQLVIIGRIEDDGRTRVGKLAQQGVDLLFGADIDASDR